MDDKKIEEAFGLLLLFSLMLSYIYGSFKFPIRTHMAFGTIRWTFTLIWTKNHAIKCLSVFADIISSSSFDTRYRTIYY